MVIETVLANALLVEIVKQSSLTAFLDVVDTIQK